MDGALLNLDLLGITAEPLSQVGVSSALLSGGFYWTHRILHHPVMYKRFHKQHHEYTGTIGFAAEHAHPFEQVFR